MVMLYLDIEVDSQSEEPHLSDKIITIQYKEVLPRQRLVILKKWDWEDEEKGERNIVQNFYDYLCEISQPGDTTTIIGFNILRFDVLFLTYKLVYFGIDTLEHVLKKFRNVFWRDLRYCLYPLNKLSFQGLSEEEVAKKLGLKQPEPPSREIPALYRREEYDKIIEHIKSEFDFLEELNRKLVYGLDDVIACYKACGEPHETHNLRYNKGWR